MSTLVRKLEPETFAGITFCRAEWLCDCGTKFESSAADPLCRACDDKRRHVEQCRREAEEKAAETVSQIPPRFRWAAFEAPELSHRVRPPSLIQSAKAALGAQNIVLLGDAGVGKTSLACALLRAIASHRGVIGHFVTSFELAEARRQHRLGAGEATAILVAARAGVLVIDEVAAELTRDTGLDEVVRARHDHERRTIYTSGFDQKAIAAKYGAGVERRIFEGAFVIRLGGKS